MKTIENASFTKRLLVSLLTIGVALHLSGCSTSSSTDESASGGDETFAEESDGDYSEDGDVASEESSSDSGETADATEEAAGEDDLGDEVADAGKKESDDDMNLDEEGGDAVADNKEGEDDLSLDDEEGLPEDVAQNAAPAEPVPEVAPAPAPSDAPVFAEQPADSTPVAAEPPPVDTSTEAPVAPAWVPVKKIKTAAFASGDANLNRVYLARPGDTRQSVAEKIYGDKKRSKDLLKWNSYLSRGMKTGDKVYYQSATNPTDATMLTYYEDIGAPAQTYTSRDGDNIRAVSKSLLGSDESWKEVWATNMDVESKGDIPAGLNIRYWPDGTAAAPVLANNAETPPAVDPMAAPTDPMAAPQGAPQDPGAMPPGNDPLAMNPTPPPPADPLAQPPMPPGDPLAAAPTATPASDPMAAGAVAAMPPSEPPPPPPPAEPPSAAPAPVEHGQQQHAGAEPAAAGTEEADNMMMMGLSGIILLAAGAVFFMIRRNKSRKVDLTQTTQVG